jgi:hypothetical protein
MTMWTDLGAWVRAMNPTPSSSASRRLLSADLPTPRPLPKVEAAFRLQAARTFANQIAKLPLDRLRATLIAEPHPTPDYDLALTNILLETQARIVALNARHPKR